MRSFRLNMLNRLTKQRLRKTTSRFAQLYSSPLNNADRTHQLDTGDLNTNQRSAFDLVLFGWAGLDVVSLAQSAVGWMVIGGFVTGYALTFLTQTS